MTDQYLTIKNDMAIEWKIKRSVFIAHAKHVLTQDEARSFLSSICQKHHNASHNCYAYRLGMGKSKIFHSSDAGEPSGSAGRPILGAIQKNKVTNTIVIVTRYYGGKKLGVRGLIDAYGQIAYETIRKAGIRRRTLMDILEISCDYSTLDNIFSIIPQYGGEIQTSKYERNVCIKVKVRRSQSPSLLKALNRYDCNISQVK